MSLVLVRGAGDLATGVAWRLHRAGFRVAMTELAEPLVVRRKVSFAEAVYEGRTEVEGVVAVHVGDAAEARSAVDQGLIPVLVDPQARCRLELEPEVLVDAIMAKRNTGTALSDAPLVVALGPGFTAGRDCHAVVETNRGHWLGRVYWQGSTQPDTGQPDSVEGRSAERVLRAPAAGHFEAVRQIADRVEAGELIARVGEAEVRAPFAGVLRGLMRDGRPVEAGLKVGDLDPRGDPRYCDSLSDKALAVGGGVLEAVVGRMARR